MAVVFTDSLTVASNVNPNVYPSSGSPDYAYIEGSGLIVNAANDRLQAPSTGGYGVLRLIHAGLPAGDQQITASVTMGAGINPIVGVLCDGTDNFYYTSMDSSVTNEVTIRRVDAGTPTDLTNVDRGLSAGAHTVRIAATVLSDHVHIEVQVDATAVIAVDDYTAGRKTSGTPVIGCYNDVANQVYVDNISVDNLAAAENNITPADATQAGTADTATLSQIQGVTPADATQAGTADATTLTQTQSLAPDDATQQSTADTATLTQIQAQTPADATQQGTAGTAILTIEGEDIDLIPADATQQGTADTAVLTQIQSQTPTDAVQQGTAGTATVTPYIPGVDLVERPVWLIKIGFSSGDVYASSTSYVVSWLGYDWQPMDCRATGYVRDQTGLAKVNVQISGHPNPLADRVLTGEHIEAPIDVYLGFLGDGGVVLDSPLLILAGRGSAGAWSKSEASFQVLQGRSAKHIFVPRRWLSPATGFHWLPKDRQTLRFKEATITLRPRGT